MKPRFSNLKSQILTGALVLAACCFAFALAPAEPAQPAVERASAGGWREAQAGYRFAFPRDHASHPDYKIEWWYYTGNLRAASGRRFGYQLTFFRIGVDPQPQNPSRWAVRDLFMAHFAITDIERERFHSFERVNRAALGWAGADTNSYRVWNEQWQARLEGQSHLLSAGEGDFRLELKLSPAKPEIAHGENGISRKGPSEGNASHYYSLTRLETAGAITVDGEEFAVEGLSWMDHEFGTSFLEQGQVGWDWFSIQLDDARELMIFQIRRADGSIDPRSSGTIVDASGQATHIGAGEFSLTPSERWRSEASGALYPTAWTIEVPAFGLRLRAAAAIPHQEMRTTESTGVTYWEGSINVEGASSERSVSGRGYLEMTGYTGQSMGAILH